MVELLRHPEAHRLHLLHRPGVVVTSCGPITSTIYGISPERVVGSAQVLRFEGERRAWRPADPARTGHLG